MNGAVLDYSLGRFDSASVRELRGVDVRLASVVLVAGARYHAAFPERRLRVTDGLRTIEQQRQLVRDGKSKTMNSSHLDGRAVDLAIITKGKANWAVPLYKDFDKWMQEAALSIGLDPGDLLWGGHWTTLRDGVHWQLMLPPLPF